MDDKKKKKPTQSPFETLTQADRSLFDLVWKTFENGVSQENSTEYGAMYQLASEMDFDQMATMLDALQSALVKDVPGSVHFALLLDFKCKILQCCLRLWPLQRFKDILYILHPIECVYMIINSTFVVSSPQDGCDGFACLFGTEIQKAYQVFSYLVLWIHWKVLDPFFNDERYFETYFFSYSKSERKKLLGGIAMDLLEFLSRTDRPGVPADFMSNLDEILPLLDKEQWGLLWKFYSTLALTENDYTRFMKALDNRKIDTLLSLPPVLDETDQWLEEIQALFMDHVANKFTISGQKGEKALKGESVVPSQLDFLKSVQTRSDFLLSFNSLPLSSMANSLPLSTLLVFLKNLIETKSVFQHPCFWKWLALYVQISHNPDLKTSLESLLVELTVSEHLNDANSFWDDALLWATEFPLLGELRLSL